MPIEIHKSGMTITGKEGINLYRMLSLRMALGLECKGMKMSRGVNAYALIKREFGFKGNKQKVYEQFCKLVEEASSKVARVLPGGQCIICDEEGAHSDRDHVPYNQE